MAERSLYDSVNSINSQYIPRFVGSNYEQLSEAKKQLDERYYKNRDYSDKVAMMLAQEQYLENDKGIKDQLAQNIYGQIDAISKSDENFENSSAAVSQLSREFFTNKERIAALDNYRRVEEARKLQTELGGNSLNFGDSLENFSTVDPNTGQTRRFNMGLEQKLDYDKQREQFYNQIEADLSSGKLKPVDVEGLHGFVSSSLTESNQNKINGYLKDAMTRYKSTAEYAQEKRKLMQLEGRTEDEANEIIEANLKAVGKERLLNRNRIQYQQDDFAVYAAKKALEGERTAVLDRANSQYLRNPNLPPNPFEDVKFTDDGKAVKTSKLRQNRTTPSVPGLGANLPSIKAIPEEEVTNNVTEAAGKIQQTNQTSLPFIEEQYGVNARAQYDLTGYTPKQIAELHNKAYEGMKSIAVNILKPSEDQLTVLDAKVLRNVQDKSVYVLDNEGKPSQGGSYATAREDLDMSPEQFSEAINKAKISGIAQFNPYNTELAGGFTVTINTPKGHRTLLVGADKAQTEFFKRGQMLSMAKMTGQEVDIPPGSGLDEYGYKAVPLLSKSGTYDVFVYRYNRNGEIIPFDERGEIDTIELNDLLQMDIDRYTKESELLSSDLTRTKNTSVE